VQVPQVASGRKDPRALAEERQALSNAERITASLESFAVTAETLPEAVSPAS